MGIYLDRYLRQLKEADEKTPAMKANDRETFKVPSDADMDDAMERYHSQSGLSKVHAAGDKLMDHIRGFHENLKKMGFNPKDSDHQQIMNKFSDAFDHFHEYAHEMFGNQPGNFAKSSDTIRSPVDPSDRWGKKWGAKE